MKKRIISLLTSLVMVISLVGVLPTMTVGAATTYERPVLSEDSAAMFIGFLMNKGNLSEQEIKNSEMYKLMINKYEGEDEMDKLVAMSLFIRETTNAMATQAADNKQYLINDLVTYLETKVPASGDNTGEQIINEYQNAALKNITDTMKNMIDNVFQRPCDSMFNVSDIFNGYKSITGAVGKAEKMINDTIAAVKGYLTVIECEKAGRYSYFSCYLSNRSAYSSPDDEVFQTIMSYNRLAASDNNWMSHLLDMFTWITGKDSFANHFDLMDSWAEFSYKMEQFEKYSDQSNGGTTGGSTGSSTSVSVGTTFTLGKLTYKVISPREVELSKCDSSVVECHILSYVMYKGNKFTVRKIGNKAFYDRNNLKTIIIPNSVTSIGESAFYQCTSLTSVTIPNSVTSIGNGAFCYCTSLTSVTIPNSVTSIENGVFQSCESLTSVTIPNSVISIRGWAFSDCSSLTSVTIPNSVTSIGNYAFSSCTSLTSITIPNSVMSIGNSAFSSCTSLTSITIPNSVTSIGNSAFSSCTSLTSITIPNSVTSIGNYAFGSCLKLLEIEIPINVANIGENALGMQYSNSHNKYFPIANFKLKCYSGTYAEDYAQMYGLDYILLDEHQHDFYLKTLIKPTCTKTGEKTYKCSLCNETKTETIPMLEHSYTEKVTKQSTCSQEGEKILTCSVCKATKTEAIPTIPHKYTETVVAPTETEQGYTLYKCSVCGDEYKDNYIDPIGKSPEVKLMLQKSGDGKYSRFILQVKLSDMLKADKASYSIVANGKTSKTSITSFYNSYKIGNEIYKAPSGYGYIISEALYGVKTGDSININLNLSNYNKPYTKTITVK